MSVITLPQQAFDQITALSKKAEDLTIDTIERFADVAGKVTAKLPTTKLPLAKLPFVPSADELIDFTYGAAETVLAASKARTLRLAHAFAPALPVVPAAKKVTTVPKAPTAKKASAARPSAKTTTRKAPVRKPAAAKAAPTA